MARRPFGYARFRLGFCLAVLLTALCAGGSRRLAAQWEGSAGATARYYPTELDRRPSAETDVTAQATAFFSWAGGDQSLRLTPFVRIDPDTRGRSRVDLLDAVWEIQGATWEVVLGMQVMSWGVLESTSIVDVINQRDHASDALRPLKLGQPLVGLRLFTGIGSFEAYAIPWIRPREWDGREATIRTDLPFDPDASRFEEDGFSRHVAWAGRWSHFFGPVDLAVSHFLGTDRAPRPSLASRAGAIVVPFYEHIHQTGLEMQWTRGTWLVKLEAVHRVGGGANDAAVGGGVEYAVGDYLSVFAEYTYDDRPSFLARNIDRDAFVGARLLTQDWTVTVGGFVDTRAWTTVASGAATRRLGTSTTVTLDGRARFGDEAEEPRFSQRLDTNVALRVSTFF